MKPRPDDDPAIPRDDPHALDAPEEDEAIRVLLKRSLQAPVPPSSLGNRSRFLEGVQRKIRNRSNRRFFADGFSTSQGRIQPTAIALVMLTLLIIAYWVLTPSSVTVR